MALKSSTIYYYVYISTKGNRDRTVWRFFEYITYGKVPTYWIY